MKTTKILTILIVALGLMVCLAQVSEAAPMGMAFTYQGQLIDANDAADGLYDFAFKLYDANVAGSKVGTDVNVADVDVIDGYFTMELDFDGSAFNGDARWLEIGVRPGVENDPCAYTPLAPRQEVTPTPYALYAETAGGDGDWQILGNDMYAIPSGTVTVLRSHDATGPDLKVSRTLAPPFEGRTWMEIDDVSIDTYWRSGDTFGTALRLNDDSAGDVLLAEGGGDVGIGTTSPAAKLTVDGGILRSGSTMYGSNADTHINLGMDSTTGTNGQNYSNATVGGGYWNTAGGNFATVGGGEENTASAYYATVGGGRYNIASGSYATVAGGRTNDATNDYATVSGGYTNTATASMATVGGGLGNIASDDYATVGGGYWNTASGSYATVAGGKNNTASSDWYATVGGGYENTASGWHSTVPGGTRNTASGIDSFAAGHRAKANHIGSFVWADSTIADFNSTGNNQFLIRASGGVGIGTMSPQGALDVNGPIYQRGGVLHADYVFEPDYQLESIDEHSEFMWSNKHLAAIPKVQVDDSGQQIVEVGAHRKGIVEELEKAHIYIEQLHKQNKTLEKRVARLEKMVLGQQFVSAKEVYNENH